MYPAPSGDKLAPAQQRPFAILVAELASTRFDAAAVRSRLPEFVAAMQALCTTDDDCCRLVDELDGWVRWYRLPGYYLAYAFQAALQETGSLSFVAACVLFADAQTHFAEDLSLASLENAYTALAGEAQTQTEPGTVAGALLLRLRATYRYYRRWYSATPYMQVDQLSESLYFDKTWRDLVVAFPELQAADPDSLRVVVARCATAQHTFCNVVALRHLGLRHAGSGDVRAAQETYRTALQTAREAGLDAEIGHLHRLLGHALQRDGKLDEADLEFRRAYTHDAHPKFAYWQALSLCELGDVRVRASSAAGGPTAVADGVRSASEAYTAGRHAFEAHVGRGVLPVARAVEQQLFRSYADTMIDVALLTGPDALLTAVEAFGPRYATDVVAESRAAGTLDAESYARYRRARAIVHERLAAPGTVAAGDASAADDAAFDVYCRDVVEHRSERRYYFSTRNALAPAIAAAQNSDRIVERLHALRVPETVFLTFDVGRTKIRAVAIDASSGAIVFGASADMDRDEWQARHAAFSQTAARSVRLIDPAIAMRDALDESIAFYEAAFGTLLDGIAPAIAGKHLKLFPRHLMNLMPMHALRINGERLSETCDVSYAPSLSLLLQMRDEAAAAPATGTLAILRDAARTPAYAGTLAQIGQAPVGDSFVVANPTWSGFRAALGARPATDIFFACHGKFDADDPQRSRLFVTANEPVAFTQMFADLDLRGCRSVLMGACESGIGRTLVAAEYIGLPLAFLAAGVRYCIGTLWQVNQLSSAILVATFYALLASGERTVVQCLAAAARRTMRLTRDEALAWVREFLPERAASWETTLRAADDLPFAHPYYWAGFYVTGDV